MPKSFFSYCFLFFLLTTALGAQVPSEDNLLNLDPAITPEQLTPEEQAQLEKEAEEAAEQACAVCGGSMLVVIAAGVVAIALNIALLVWVARDAKNRSMDSSVLWMLLVMFTGFVGLLIYILSRPQGPISQCASCGGKRLAASAKCPHCHNS